MPFIPHTEDEIQKMLATIGVDSIDDLFDEIPANLRCEGLKNGVPAGISEMQLTREMRDMARKDKSSLCFIGAGAYEHHIPAAVWQLASRGEFLTAYTPYQAEASQGTLQLLYEYQTMMANLTSLNASNASLYDGASGLAEAILMAVRLNRKAKSRRILIPKGLHPRYREVAKTITEHQQIELIEIPFDKATGGIDQAALDAHAGSAIAAVVIPQPNFFGCLEAVDELTDWAHANNALAIAVVNPIALALLTPPGEWGEKGVDIACGEGQPLGIPLASGGPYFGFMCCKQAHVRQMPGRIIGRTIDLNGDEGFVLTLQAREQHIRRSKATSNICTNQGLAVTAATIYMSLLGGEGLACVAGSCHENLILLQEKLQAVAGVEMTFAPVGFHEMVITLSRPVAEVVDAFNEAGIQAGYDLTAEYPELGNSLLVCVTETKIEADLDLYCETMQRVLTTQSVQAKSTATAKEV